jgi:putative cell wall-binding protein
VAALVALTLATALVATPTESKAGLTATEIVVLGGPNAVSDAVLTHLMACTDGQARRVSGTNRYATAANVSKDTFASSSFVFVATGENFSDAVSSSPSLQNHPHHGRLPDADDAFHGEKVSAVTVLPAWAI